MILRQKLLAAALTFVFSLSSLNSFADTSDEHSVEELVRKAKVAFDAGDSDTYDPLLMRIFYKITGFAYDLPHVPEGMPDDEYIQKRCEFDRITQPIFSTEFWNELRYQADLIAFGAVRDGREQSVMTRAMTECVFDDGQPTKTSQFIRDGIAWANAFFAVDAERALHMAQKIKERSAQNPKIIELKLFASMVKHHAQRKKAPNSDHRITDRKSDDFFPQATLVEKADKGSLEAQLDVAHRLETGNKFRQDNAMAYFWYQQALENGGGEAAQAGLDRLLPHLTDVDFISIDIWTRNKHRPY